MAANPHPTLSLLYSFLLVYVCAQLDKILPSLLVANFHAKKQTKQYPQLVCIGVCQSVHEHVWRHLNCYIYVCICIYSLYPGAKVQGVTRTTRRWHWTCFYLAISLWRAIRWYSIVNEYTSSGIGGKKIYSRAYTSWVIHQLLERVLFCQPFLFCSGKGEKKVDTHWEREREQHPHLTYFGAAVN